MCNIWSYWQQLSEQEQYIHTCQCTFHICWNKSFNKNGYHIANIGHITLILYGLIDSSLVYICTKTQPTTTSTSQVTAIYFQDANVPARLHIYVISFKWIYGEVCAYMYQIWCYGHHLHKQEHCTYFVNCILCYWYLSLKGIWLLPCKYKLHCPYSVLEYRSNIGAHMC